MAKRSRTGKGLPGGGSQTPSTTDGPDSSSLDAAELAAWEKLFGLTFCGLVAAQRRSPDPKMLAKVGKRLTDAGFECIREKRGQA